MAHPGSPRYEKQLFSGAVLLKRSARPAEAFLFEPPPPPHGALLCHQNGRAGGESRRGGGTSVRTLQTRFPPG